MAATAEIKKKTRNDNPSIGTWLQIPSTDNAEIIGRAGYDWVAVDLEHGAFARQILPDIFRAIELGGAVPFARVADNSMTSIKAALDSGARGLIFPMIENRAQLDKAIALSLFPPAGVRGVGYCRTNLFGKHFQQTLDENQNLFFCAQIEHIRALDNLDGILSHPKLNALIVGPYDLSGSMNLTGQFSHPEYQAALNTIAQQAEIHGVTMGLHIVQPNPAELEEKIAEGYRFIAYGTDAVFLYRACQRPGI